MLCFSLLEYELASLYVLVFALHEDHGSMALIGALYYRRTRSCGHMKDGNLAIRGLLLVFGENKKKS